VKLRELMRSHYQQSYMIGHVDCWWDVASLLNERNIATVEVIVVHFIQVVKPSFSSKFLSDLLK
jgi:hypothetical protein